MAPTRVAGDLYFDIDGQLMEIKRQLRQREGYPYYPMQLVEHLQAAIEGNLVDRHGRPFGKRGVASRSRVIATHTITCEGRKTSELVKLGKYDWANPDITDVRFPVKSYDPVTKTIEFVQCDYHPSNEEVFEELAQHGLKRPTYEDALEFGIQHPEEQRKRALIFLHEPVLRASGDCGVLALDAHVGVRRLDLVRFDLRWIGYFVFAGVRISS